MLPPHRPLGIANPLLPPMPLGQAARDRPLTVLRSLLSFEPTFYDPPPEPTAPPPLDIAPPRPEPPPAAAIAPPEIATPMARHAIPHPPQPQKRQPPDWQASDYRRPHRLP